MNLIIITINIWFEILEQLIQQMTMISGSREEFLFTQRLIPSLFDYILVYLSFVFLEMVL